jgi:hypothetical protein
VTRVLAVIPLVLLTAGGLAACGGSGTKTATATVTTTVTVTATPTDSASSDPLGSSSASSSPPAAEAGASGPDACSLLTLAEAEKVAGTALMKPVGAGANPSGGFVECQFTGPTTGPTAQVEVYVGDGAKQQLHIERDNLKHAFTTVPGIGDQCVQEDGFIFVEKNGLWASIHLVRLNDPKQNVTPMQTGIKELVARLP